ncbi:AraC family transcriptional regulator [Phyllobacterium sp. P30BS-XVII]|uniref:AraC family transcriptional regulator n=1 Tax=Phyllobacterium sp. P30BS-XVII TaxID=2587046 RepID=UPI000DD4F8C3|nr:AraC family transcriptional regulator [Phyllobacterium sp. P30BS-XVII]MBA8902562.1 AraC-like DNA-binding protein [Phyllobacterium sp. P30BS-XVII]
MSENLREEARRGLGRLCERPVHDAILSAPSNPGLERMEARFTGDAFEPHRHDTYAIGVTLHGVQTFQYRGEKRQSLPGNILVLHPDEVHDGGAGTDDGLRYRIIYLEPALAIEALGGNRGSLPFVSDPVFADAPLVQAISMAFNNLDEEMDELLADDIIAQLAQGLSRHAGQPLKPMGKPAVRQAGMARDYLADNALRVVRSQELETVSGLDRYALSRHFRTLYATSPHRFLLMRRLQRAKDLMKMGVPLAEIAAETGFSDQSHLNRQFKKAFGITPGRWAALTAANRAF